MWQTGISLVASPLAKSLVGIARELARSRIPPATQAIRDRKHYVTGSREEKCLEHERVNRKQTRGKKVPNQQRIETKNNKSRPNQITHTARPGPVVHFEGASLPRR